MTHVFLYRQSSECFICNEFGYESIKRRKRPNGICLTETYTIWDISTSRNTSWRRSERWKEREGDKGPIFIVGPGDVVSIQIRLS